MLRLRETRVASRKRVSAFITFHTNSFVPSMPTTVSSTFHLCPTRAPCYPTQSAASFPKCPIQSYTVAALTLSQHTRSSWSVTLRSLMPRKCSGKKRRPFDHVRNRPRLLVLCTVSHVVRRTRS
jgi:hypothetical protein